MGPIGALHIELVLHACRGLLLIPLSRLLGCLKHHLFPMCFSSTLGNEQLTLDSSQVDLSLHVKFELLRGATDTLVRVNLRNGTIKSLKQPQVVYETTKPERKTAEPYSYSITESLMAIDSSEIARAWREREGRATESMKAAWRRLAELEKEDEAALLEEAEQLGFA